MKANLIEHIPQGFPLGNKEMGTSQITNTLLMVEPVSFGFNDQTATNNFFQQRAELPAPVIQQLVLAEFHGMVEKLRANGIKVIVVKDTFEPPTPDSIFPNNWISFHEAGQAVLYPMFAINRRNERRTDIIQLLEEQGCNIKNLDDFTFWEEQSLFLEGTGSMVLDRVNKIAYAALSERTDVSVFLQFCNVFGYEPVYFNAYQWSDGQRVPIYHTNVIMCVADRYAVICSSCIDSQTERETVLNSLTETEKEIILITETQMQQFAGNMLQVKNQAGQQFLVMSQTAHDSLNTHQLNQLKTFNDLITIPIPTIEKIGGGSVRCMMAEIF